MTKLECSASNCVHYSEGCCCKSSINVDGAGANAQMIPVVQAFLRILAVFLRIFLRRRNPSWM